MMGRRRTIERARAVHKIYEGLAPDLKPIPLTIAKGRRRRAFVGGDPKRRPLFQKSADNFCDRTPRTAAGPGAVIGLTRRVNRRGVRMLIGVAE